MDDKVTIKIPRPLYNRLQKIVDETGFDSVTDFIVYCLRDIVAEKNDEGVKERLRSLGYDI
ncbi:MAG: CopG family transcriptional regulator [Patescibacteria group bacterium]|jgi:metal-responsive CopG/Arc/MetJ family transcriptional regulator